MEYQYKNLSPDDFEELAQDVASIVFGNAFEKFKPGKDGGIDLRLIRNDQNVLVQVKHMIGSYGSRHRSEFKKEYEKLKNNPELLRGSEYAIITSCNLSQLNKKEIREIFNDSISSEANIIGIEDIEKILRDNENLVRKHFKLWISSSSVLFNILNNRVYGKSEDYFNRIATYKVRLFVKTKNIDAALEILQDKKVLVVTGEPGIGKTTLSELICLYYVGKGYQFVYCDDVDEAENVFAKDVKQIFLLDDFLGSNFLEVFSGKIESKILRFMERVKHGQNKALILNSRTTIYQQASNKGIHWREHNWGDLNYCIDISAYEELDRAKMLYNHLRYRGLDEVVFEKVKTTKSYFKIIRHANYSPRTIETITSSDKIARVSADEYLNFVLTTLENPYENWRSAYKTQINNEQRWLLQCLFTFRGLASDMQLRKSYKERLRFEKESNGHAVSESGFQDATAELIDGFIYRIMEIGYRSHGIHWSYINPSIFDYLKIVVTENGEILHGMIESTISIEQWDTLLSIDSIKDEVINRDLLKRLFDRNIEFECNPKRNRNLEIIKLELDHGIGLTNEKFLLYFNDGLNDLPDKYDQILIIKALRGLNKRGLIGEFYRTQRDIYEFCVSLLQSAVDLDDFEAAVNEFDFYMPNWSLLEEDYDGDPIKNCLSDWRVLRRVNSLVYDEAERLISEDSDIPEILDTSSMSERINQLEKELRSRLNLMSLNDYEMPTNAFNFNYEEQVSRNRLTSESDDEDEYVPSIDETTTLTIDERIERVFKE
jgi:hypothetical protein